MDSAGEKRELEDASARRNGQNEHNEDVDCTPKSELPPALSVSTPNASEAAARQESTTAKDYFHLQPVGQSVEYLPPTLSIASPSATPSISVSDVTTSGHIQSLEPSASLDAAERPTAHSTISSLSIQSTDSSVTVTPGPLGSSRYAVNPQPYPNQSYAALHSQHHPPPHRPGLRPGASQTSQVHSFASAIASRHGASSQSSTNSLSPQPGLFTLATPSTPAVDSSEAPGTYASPYLHFTHTHVPRETHTADVDVDPISGRKIINQYEILDELGRGTHGKVKLGRNLKISKDDEDAKHLFVAIKIVERFSKRRKLGRLGTTEDKVKKEVAILKKARHPNVVALLEVIDDPSRKKVYIVLEWVEKGEINWRVKGPKEIAVVEARRYETEKHGRNDIESVAKDVAVRAEAEKRLAKQKRRQLRAYRMMRRGTTEAPQAWSIELAGDHESDDSEDDERSLSRVSTATTESYSGRYMTAKRISRAGSLADATIAPSPSHYLTLTDEPDVIESPEQRASSVDSADLEGSMYGAYDTGLPDPSRTASQSNSLRLSRRGNSEDLMVLQDAKEILDSYLDPELEYVPVMTMEQIRVAFRDTLLGLQYLHFQGIVHRDIKPPNLLATGQGRVKISDFGVSYLGRPVHHGEKAEDLSEADTQDLGDEAKELAKTVGTPAFYAPELCNTDPSEENLPITKAIDVWALGVTLFCMIFARTPFVENEFIVMRQIADEEVYIPRQRLLPVNTKPNSRSNSGSRAVPRGNAQAFRHEMDIVYEQINDELYDLLKRLLTKDPQKRITLEEVRHNAWVVADLPNRVKWLEETDPHRQKEGKIDISKQEIDDAVVPLTLVDRMKSGLHKITTSLGKQMGLAGKSSKSSSRARGHSNASDTQVPSANSSSSTISSDARRLSLLGDEQIFNALKLSREDHPLSRSLAASPEQVREKWIEDPNDGGDESAGSTARPPAPTRSATLTSATGSLRTVKQSDYRRLLPGDDAPPSPGHPGTPVDIHPDRFGGILGGAGRKIMNSLREKSSHATLERVRSREPGTAESPDRHAEPTLAVSQAFAAGHMNLPEALKDRSPPNEPDSAPRTPSAHNSGYNSTASSQPHSTLTSPDNQQHTWLGAGFLSRTSSSSSVNSFGRNLNAADASRAREQLSRRALESNAEDWKRADDERVRRAVARSREDAERALSPRTAHDSPRPSSCPPSPDDDFSNESYSRTQANTECRDAPIENSPGTNGAHPPPAMVSSSSDLGSAVSMSISNPSIPSVISEASSIDPSDRYTYDTEHKRDPSSDDTMNADDGHEFYSGDAFGQNKARRGRSPDYDDDDDSDTDDDGGLVMKKGPRRQSTAKPGGLAAALEAQNSRNRRIAIAAQKRTSRSGSNNTMERIRTHDSIDDHER